MSEFLSVDQAAARLGAKPRVVLSLIDLGELDAHKLNPEGVTSPWLVAAEEVARYEALMARTCSTKEAARIAGARPHQVYAAVQNGTLKARKVGGRWRVDREALDRWTPPPPRRAGPRDVPPEKHVRAARAWVRSGKYTVAQVAKALRVDESTVSRWVSGERRAQG